MRLRNSLRALAICAISLLAPLVARAHSCLPIIQVNFSPDGTSVSAHSSKELSNVVLKFCDGTAHYKFDGLGSYKGTYSYQGKTLAGVWVKSGCNGSGEGSGYGEFFGRSCQSTPKPTATPCIPTPTPTATPPNSTPTPTPTPTPPSQIQICYNPQGSSSAAEQRWVTAEELAALHPGDYTLGQCPLDCMGIPGGRATVDVCGVCGGDGSSCADCLGIPNGSAQLDACGVCNGNGTSCLGCDNVPNSGKVVDACGVCGGDSSSCKDCLGVPNGGAMLDECGVCGGNNSSCLDCSGRPNGSARIDVCGVCGGDGSSCTSSSCVGTVDRCGVCNGLNACLDCSGVPNGGATFDCCGICGGNGDPRNCPELCTVYDTTKLKRKYLRQVKSLYRTLKKYSARQKVWSKGALSVKTRISRGTLAYEESRSLLSSFIANEIKVCNTEFCAKTNFESVLSSLNQNTRTLYRLSRKAQYGSVSACGRIQNDSSAKRSSILAKQAAQSLRQIPGEGCSN